MERKHTSLPRSTIVHSTPIPVKEQPRIGPSREKPSFDESCKNPHEIERFSGNAPRTSQVPQRVPTDREVLWVQYCHTKMEASRIPTAHKGWQ
uniref:Uncharacterized protein n=1 Tax=Arundo donax TaxID=35708 RepID=A0A0A9E2K1_ARUDO